MQPGSFVLEIFVRKLTGSPHSSPPKVAAILPVPLRETIETADAGNGCL